MINNFEIIKNLLQFENPGDCYFIQLLKRKKDNPQMERNMVNVENFFIHSIEEYEHMKSRIIELANLHNARVYIRVNRRNTEKLALNTLVQVSNLILSKDYKSVKNAYLTAAGKTNSEPMKRWVVDIDRQGYMSDIEFSKHVGFIINVIDELHAQCNRNSKQGVYQKIALIETKGGMHLITNPFNLNEFNKRMEIPIDVHKDNPTILYTP